MEIHKTLRKYYIKELNNSLISKDIDKYQFFIWELAKLTKKTEEIAKIFELEEYTTRVMFVNGSGVLYNEMLGVMQILKLEFKYKDIYNKKRG